MVRATAAEIKKLFLGKWPAGATDSNVGDILAGIDYTLDGHVKRHYDTSLSETDTDVVHIANKIGKQEILHALWSSAGGSANANTGPEPLIFTDEIVSMIEASITDTVRDGSSTIPIQDVS